mmetsp:Transcript_92680/g.265663  ORF Transcript_92680/g.265663 Transcript_92680/m.265663 type:complete len:136 (-) Transcript_92680:219-626(-)
MSSIALGFLGRAASQQQSLLGSPSARSPGSRRAAGTTPKMSPKSTPDRFGATVASAPMPAHAPKLPMPAAAPAPAQPTLPVLLGRHQARPIPRTAAAEGPQGGVEETALEMAMRAREAFLARQHRVASRQAPFCV